MRLIHGVTPRKFKKYVKGSFLIQRKLLNVFSEDGKERLLETFSHCLEEVTPIKFVVRSQEELDEIKLHLEDYDYDISRMGSYKTVFYFTNKNSYVGSAKKEKLLDHSGQIVSTKFLDAYKQN